VIKTLAIGRLWRLVAVGAQLRMQHDASVSCALTCATHAKAPLRIWAMWMNLIGTPMRSAQPR
jgi:hypothetical protein